MNKPRKLTVEEEAIRRLRMDLAQLLRENWACFSLAGFAILIFIAGATGLIPIAK